MKTVDLNKYIVADPDVCHGKPTFKGTRIMVWQILELLESGQKSGDIHRAFPNLPKGAVAAALHYAAEKAKNTSYFQPTSSPKHSLRLPKTASKSPGGLKN